MFDVSDYVEKSLKQVFNSFKVFFKSTLTKHFDAPSTMTKQFDEFKVLH